MAAAEDLRATGDHLERMLEELEAACDPRTYDRVAGVLRTVVDLYGAALAQVMEIVREGAPEVLEDLAADELVASLLVVHGLHPLSLATRVDAALAAVRPILAAHGGDVELLGVDEDAGAVQLRLLGSCDGCPSSSVTLRAAVETAITDAAPEIVRFDVEPRAAKVPGVPVTLSPKPAFAACPTGLADLAGLATA
jgi:Fe-S cluster biogenesis protein NfuA